ncbi:hypothetical protein D9756_009195 [Leucocoprinus leucothites]|uniref:4Fe-4S ferredoxin-type domain-containing protein n=1 Tax=Leucocoprinus leucothites TaxID=201217 RepID=A0A8H5D0Q8_9AGAR|nr:hypothetical protein D9756_009195 [Leucoagaricus leucothites]
MKTSSKYFIWATLLLSTLTFAIPQNRGPCGDLAQCTQRCQQDCASLSQNGTPAGICNDCQGACMDPARCPDIGKTFQETEAETAALFNGRS